MSLTTNLIKILSYDATLELFENGCKDVILVVCPGGGYHHLSPREATPVANKFFNAGIPCAILRYTVLKHYPTQYDELIESLKVIHNLGYKKIFLCGFSAGGHLASLVGATYKSKLDFDIEGLILGYPVIQLVGEKIHQGTRFNLLGVNEDCKEAYDLSVANLVTKDMPKTFLFTTYDDNSVPFENSLALIEALRKNNIPLEAYIFPHGPHGVALADETAIKDGATSYVIPLVATWSERAISFIKNNI